MQKTALAPAFPAAPHPSLHAATDTPVELVGVPLLRPPKAGAATPGTWHMRARSLGALAFVLFALALFFVGLLEFFRAFDSPQGSTGSTEWTSWLMAPVLGSVATLVCCAFLSLVFDLACRMVGGAAFRNRPRHDRERGRRST